MTLPPAGTSSARGSVEVRGSSLVVEVEAVVAEAAVVESRLAAAEEEEAVEPIRLRLLRNLPHTLLVLHHLRTA